MKIEPALTASQIEHVRALFREYHALLGVDLGFQRFEAELVGLPGVYAAPGGCLLLGTNGDTALGCVALRPMGSRVCEMKRLYVRPEARGGGLGRQLAREIIQRARQLGYTHMRLDTLDRLTEAMGLYRNLGFRETAPYYDNPLPGVIYWELDLLHAGPTAQSVLPSDPFHPGNNIEPGEIPPCSCSTQVGHPANDRGLDEIEGANPEGSIQ